ncbi:MAG: flagellar protein FlaG [Spirochaetes bacterium]|nr:flagellar protein FlaG [Spirochaetota bacterium]
MSIDKIIFENLDGAGRYQGNGSRKTEAQEPAPMKPGREPTKDEVYEAVDKLNQAVKGLNERLSFDYHEKINRVVVRVINSETNEVLKEIPPREVVRLLERLREYLGVFVDEQR